MIIGVFDSGIGGLSVLHLALRRIPGARFLYYADEAHVPYGERTPEEIVSFTDEAISFLVDQGAQAVLVACNTATSAAIRQLRQKYDLPLIGMEPAVKKAVDTYPGQRSLVAATPVTLRGEKLRELIRRVDRQHVTDFLPLPELVRFAESGEFDSPAVEDYLRCKLESFALPEYAALVLGCTHFNYFKDSFRRLLPDTVHLLDGNAGTVRQLLVSTQFLTPETVPGDRVRFYSSGTPVTDTTALERLTGLMARLDKMLEIE